MNITLWFYPFKKEHFLNFFEKANATPQELYDWFLNASARCILIHDTGGNHWHFPCIVNPFKMKTISVCRWGNGHYLESKQRTSVFTIWDRTIKWLWYREWVIKGYLKMFPEVKT